MAESKLTLARREKEALIGRGIEINGALLDRMGVAPEVFERVAINALIANPDLALTSQQSFGLAVMRCAEIGLLPDGKQAAIVPFKVKGKPTATLIPMIEGRIRLAKAATPGLTLRVRVVYKDDDWKYSEGLTPILHHVPSDEAVRDDELLIAAYAIAHAPGTAVPEFEVMLRPELLRRKAQSPSAKNTQMPWTTHFAEMCKKTVLGALLKRLPKNPRMPEPAFGDGDLIGHWTPDDATATDWTPTSDTPVLDAEVVAEVPDSAEAWQRPPVEDAPAPRREAAPAADGPDPALEPADPHPEPESERSEPIETEAVETEPAESAAAEEQPAAEEQAAPPTDDDSPF